jgi:hypothetical protein
VSYEPHFILTLRLLAQVEAIAALRERIQAAAVELAWIPVLYRLSDRLEAIS